MARTLLDIPKLPSTGHLHVARSSEAGLCSAGSCSCLRVVIFDSGYDTSNTENYSTYKEVMLVSAGALG